mgnify:CR=1 FL=1
MMGHDGLGADHACLPTTPPPEGAWCWLASWGDTQASTSYELYDDYEYEWIPKKLQQVGVNIFSRKYCRSHSNYKFWHVDPNSQFCAGTIDRDDDGLTDVGAGWGGTDNGAPLICDVDGRPDVYGIVAFNQGRENGFEWDPRQSCKIPYPSVSSKIKKYENPEIKKIYQHFIFIIT